MKIGHGDIASVLTDRKDILYFAAGVSNSQETRESEYKRERHLLLSQDKDKHIVYFSSLAIFYSNTRYTKHKKTMELLVKTCFENYTIIRLGNILWGTNPKTLINYLKTHPKAEIKDEYRYVCDKEEFLHWINLIPQFDCEINIPGRRLKVAEIVKEYCE